MGKNGKNGQKDEKDLGNCDEVISESIGSWDTMVSVSKSSYLPLCNYIVIVVRQLTIILIL